VRIGLIIQQTVKPFLFSRPISGMVNFCPDQLENQTDQEMIDVGKHEVLHILVCIYSTHSRTILNLAFDTT